MSTDPPTDPLAVFSEPARAWFSSTFAEPTPVQAQGWPHIAVGEHTLLCAPTGTGKTLAAFLWAIDRLMARGDSSESPTPMVEAECEVESPGMVVLDAGGAGAGAAGAGVGAAAAGVGAGAGARVLYVSPLRALASDIEKNLRAPLRGIRFAAKRLGVAVNEPSVGVRTGDTSASERRRLVRNPPDILITTPESLFLMLTSRARETLGGVRHVIIDEIHAVAGDKRGSHLMVSLERLEELCDQPPQRIALSATQRPLDEIAVFLGGFEWARDGSQRARPVTVVDVGVGKRLEVEVVIPIDDMGVPSRQVEDTADDTTQAPLVPDSPGSAQPVDAVYGQDAQEWHGAAPSQPTLLPNAGLSRSVAKPAARRSIWPSMLPRLLDLVESHRSTLIFANARRLCERLASRLNELHADRQSGPSGPSADPRERGGALAGGARAGGVSDNDSGTSHDTAPRGGSGAVLRALAQPAGLGDQQADTILGEGTDAARQDSGSDPLRRLGDEQAGIGVLEDTELVKAHHGSLSRTRRLLIEDELKRGELRGLVATSTLELGIDMGAVDLVLQVGSPRSASSGMQRIGRAGHRVGEPSRGKIFPTHRSDLLEAAALVDRMRQGLVERTRVPRNPLDVAAQQIVAMCAMDDWPVAGLAAVLRRSASFSDLSDEVLYNLFDLLSGVYPAEEFSELRPRIVWDRAAGVLRGRAGSQRLAVTNCGTIPDRGLFGVFLPDGTRVGELDEEMVHESRVGETFLLGASTWRIIEITCERVVVTPAPGELGRMPFWLGDGPGRPVEVGRAVGRLVRELRDTTDPVARAARLRDRHGCDATAAADLLHYLDEQAAAAGAVPDDRTVVVERFRDEIGDWRVCLLTPFGARVHAPWGIALQARLGEMWDMDVEMMWSDEGIVIRLPEAIDQVALDDLVFEPEEINELVIQQLPETSVFASRFRECAARALLLPRRRPDQRTPLWQQRQRSADLLRAAARHPSFPMLLEATRECVNDVFDLPSLVEIMSDLRSRRIRMTAVDTPSASPFAQSLLFSWVAVYMYEGDAPLAERRAAALTLDRGLLNDLLGEEELREVLDPEVLAEMEVELQCLTDGRRARDADEAHDMLRILGPLSLRELVARSTVVGSGAVEPDGVVESVAGGVVGASDGSSAADDREGAAVEGAAVEMVVGWVRRLVSEHRAIEVRLAGRLVVADAADAARLRDAAGVALPRGLPAACVASVPDPLGDLCVRYARTHGPFKDRDLACWLGVDDRHAAARLAALAAEGRLLLGEFRPSGTGSEFCDADVLRRIRRRCLAALRSEVEAVEPEALARFLPAWQGVGSCRQGVAAVADAVSQLQGAPVAASVLESDVLSARVSDYQSAYLDALCTAGEVVWVGAGSLGASDGRVRLMYRDQAALLVPAADVPADAAAAGDAPEAAIDAASVSDQGAVHDALRRRLRDLGASFWGDLVAAVQEEGLPYDAPTVLAALWDLVWSGEVTNDSLAPVRAFTAGRGLRHLTHGAGARSTAGGTFAATDRAGFQASGRSTRTVRSSYRRPRAMRLRSSLGGLSATGPPAAVGRWSLVSPLLTPEPSPAEAALAQARQLLDRYGVVTRQTFLGEAVKGGFAGVYPVLKLLEERGEVRRGYFVAGLGAAQFALPGAVDRLRTFREAYGEQPGGGLLVLAATDTAQPYGAVLEWPPSRGRPARAAGAHVVLSDGVPVAELSAGGRSLVTFPAADDSDLWIEALQRLVRSKRLSKLEITRVDGIPIRETSWPARLQAAGFTSGYRGMLYRY